MDARFDILAGHLDRMVSGLKYDVFYPDMLWVVDNGKTQLFDTPAEVMSFCKHEGLNEPTSHRATPERTPPDLNA
ncbi:hypothetical protein NDU88_002691 [Pleurodeles waltl]|uniref:Uncharacterized protein n=1 Tax=Pleurodeles waltl TaxID=8319 RepID=A0AAV7KSW4_PLEWA|nr:hypothetical protein NDU88_002691 [Pleurodeles waltl]